MLTWIQQGIKKNNVGKKERKIGSARRRKIESNFKLEERERERKGERERERDIYINRIFNVDEFEFYEVYWDEETPK